MPTAKPIGTTPESTMHVLIGHSIAMYSLLCNECNHLSIFPTRCWVAEISVAEDTHSLTQQPETDVPNGTGIEGLFHLLKGHVRLLES
jgi:hypothetical protein